VLQKQTEAYSRSQLFAI